MANVEPLDGLLLDFGRTLVHVEFIERCDCVFEHGYPSVILALAEIDAHREAADWLDERAPPSAALMLELGYIHNGRTSGLKARATMSAVNKHSLSSKNSKQYSWRYNVSP